MKQTALGIDIGGTFTKFGLSDIDGNILMEGSIPTYTHKEIKGFMDALSEAIREKLDQIIEPIDEDFIGQLELRFYPNGTAEPVDLRVTDGSEAYILSLDPVTGQPTVINEDTR